MASTVGVLGGMGPDATIDFFAKVVAQTPARLDQDHVPMIIYNNPGVPNRQAAIIEGAENPGPTLANMARKLESAGADFLVMPCNSAHAFLEYIEAATSIPFLSILDVTVAACRGHRTVGVLATDGCLAYGGYQDRLARAGIEATVPEPDDLERLMWAINQVKAGHRGASVKRAIKGVAAAVAAKGASAMIAGCTEIPLVLESEVENVPVVSSTEVLAQATVNMALGRKDNFV